ncbi:MAG: serine hydroxymethyltransferase [Clostridiales bacterium]|nr:serine hydroxymethyltransferase [Clostridiales bacterium]
MSFEHIKSCDPEIFEVINAELKRQKDNIELIASENFTSVAVMETLGSPLTNKYAEGYPGARYYGGCEFVDIAETLAIERAKELFGAEHANVQAHSGSQANVAVLVSVLNPGDVILGMDLSAGGHLTHGSKASITGRHFNSFHYGVNASTETLDYDEILGLAKAHQPKMIICGASAYSRLIDFEKIREICDEVGAYMLADIAHLGGLVAAGVHPSPVPYADFVTVTTHKSLRGPRGGVILCKAEYAKKIDSAIFPRLQGGPLMNTIAAKAVCFKEAMTPEFVKYQEQIVRNASVLADALIEKGVRIVSGGTDNHLMLCDVSSKRTTGAEMQELLEKSNITANKNTIPFETLPPHLASGIRFGTPAVTTRGFKEKEMLEVADIISLLLDKRTSAIPEAKERVAVLTKAFPLYENLSVQSRK